MPDFIDFLPLVRRSVDDIRASLDADANAGLLPDDARWVDTVPGGHFHDLTQAPALEIARAWDFLGAEVPAAALLPYAFGEYLDDWGDALALPRKDEVRATGTVVFTGAPDSAIATGVQVAVPQTDPDADPLTFETTASGTIPNGGTIALPVRALEAGSGGNVPTGAVSLLLSPVAGVTAVTNPAGTLGGADVESDDPYRDRLLLELSGTQGSGTVTDYQRWALAYPGVGFVTVEPIFNGPGTVRVTITDPENDPCTVATVNGLQALLDPVAGQGRGQAPIGHAVTVATVTSINITVAATVTHRTGYSLDGAGGTIATRAAIEAALAGYIEGLAPGDDVILNRVESLFFSVEGVYNVAGVTLNGSAADVAVAGLQVPALVLPATLA